MSPSSSSSRLTAHLSKSGIQLTPLAPIEQLSPRVVRVLGDNPGPYTLQGTGTYLIGTGPARLLLDTGDGGPGYLPLLRAAMQSSGCAGIEGIVISHWHHDHLGGVRQVQQALGPDIPVYKYMPEQPEEAYGGEGSKSVPEMWPLDKFTPLVDKQRVATQGATLVAHYAPGHANDLCVFMLEEEGAMFSSDNVLGQGTGVARDLIQYLHSLDVMLALRPARLYPGHGPVVEDGEELIREYKQHRLARVQQVLSALRPDQPRSLEALVKAVYPELPDALLGPAMFNLLLALRVLEAQGQASCTSAVGGLWKKSGTKL
jgi:ribonuclease/clavin/mitogillin